MAELQLGNIKPAGADNVVVDSRYVRGGYLVASKLVELFPVTAAEIDASIKGANGKNIIKGSLCHCQEDSKFYQYNGTTWVEKDLMSPADRQKLAGIAAGAEVNVQADWNETSTSSDAYIRNKPSVIVEGDGRLTNPRTPTSHAHGKITNDGRLDTASRIVVTDSNKNVTVGTIDPIDLATKLYVTEQVANAVTGGTLVLTGYATEDYVNNAISALPKVTTSQEEPTGGNTGDIWFKY